MGGAALEQLDRFLMLWNKALREAYRSAELLMGDFRRTEGRDLRGHVRRARCEEALAGVAEEVGLLCIGETNSTRSYSHRLVVTDHFRLVQCYHANAHEIVRFAAHRGVYASSNQGDLFRSPSTPAASWEQKAFGILQHGEHPKVKGEIGYSHLKFPNADLDRYRSSIDLLARYDDYHTAAPETRTPGHPVIRPKRREDTMDDDGA